MFIGGGVVRPPGDHADTFGHLVDVGVPELSTATAVSQLLCDVGDREEAPLFEDVRRTVERERDEPAAFGSWEVRGQLDANDLVPRAVAGLVDDANNGVSELLDISAHVFSVAWFGAALLIPLAVVVFEAPSLVVPCRMAWGTDFPLVEVAQQLLETRLRAERLRLGQRLQALESRVEARGLPTEGFKDLRKALFPPTPPAPDRVDPSLVLLRKPKGVWRRKYLAVRVKPGSVF